MYCRHHDKNTDSISFKKLEIEDDEAIQHDNLLDTWVVTTAHSVGFV
jgi:hypothetical protein